MEIAKVNATRQKKTERVDNFPACLVCGRLCLSWHYYGVICCEACKKFFHRNASQDSSAPQCLNDSPCDVTKESMTSYNIESFSNEKEKANVMRWQKPSGNYRACLVCGRYSHFYRYTGEMCCEACKKFYRRTVAQQFVPPCLTNLQCDVTKEKCRHCRYQKCQSVEMDRRFLKIKSSEKFDRCIDGLKQIEQPFRRIWDSSKILPEAYTSRHETMSGLLQDNYNLLSNANQFPEEPIGWDKAQFINELETNGLFSLHALNVQCIKDWFVLVELAKTFPFIKKLEPNDQICHLKHVELPAKFLISSFYAYSMNAKCHTRKNGLEIPAILEVKQVHGDQRVRTLVLQTACNLVQKMSGCALNYEEFLLLLAIHLSNSNADGLSPSSRKKLYKESIHYSKTLQNMLQCKYGPIGGAQKFASLIGLLNCAISLKFKYFEMLAYMEVFYAKQELHSVYPKIMHSI